MIVGDGSLRTDLERAVVRLGLRRHVLLPGHIANPLPLVAYADALVLTSEREGFGLVVAEAMAVGTPVVSIESPGGVVETIGNAGLLVPPGHPDMLGEAMERIAGDEALRRTLIERGTERIEAFHPLVIAQQWIDLIEKARLRKIGAR